ncbi:hypothetical protein VE01_04447 [Pseudogymnoascus verrucosus]|uniref:Rhodopsin domain-containing protein n=1 Tax=Pseudogymnoascus verrucosus TaxID=342668 RepID=A0A1B8GP17_9PEZI|nr:uncharacterized protein VE01_04447 [Pseudogymnoascus verrucosus]OBT97577.1 hypothetical protein VE01_04447 [Pseudogymnoascus verrucosus]
MSIAAILALGILAGVSAMIRIPYLQELKFTNDYLYIAAYVNIWSTVEAGLGIIAASAYTLRPLFRSFLRGYSHSNRAGHM